jgi:hypothetical protein
VVVLAVVLDAQQVVEKRLDRLAPRHDAVTLLAVFSAFALVGNNLVFNNLFLALGWTEKASGDRFYKTPSRPKSFRSNFYPSTYVHIMGKIYFIKCRQKCMHVQYWQYGKIVNLR